MSLATQTFPAANVTELPAGTALAATGLPDVPVFCGPCAAGPFTPTLFAASDIASVTALYVNGPTVKESVMAAAQVAQQFVILRTPVTTVAGTLGSVTVVRTSSGTVPTNTISGTPTDGADVVIKYGVSSGVTGTGPIAYQVSTNGGSTYGTTQALGTATTIVVLGVMLALGSGKTITAADTTAWLQTVASSAIQPLTFAGTGTSAVTATGTPLDGYEVAFKIVDDGSAGAGTTIGTLGTTGSIKFQYSLDASAVVPTWSAASLGAASSFLLLDGPISTASTGVTLNFGSGNLVTGDTVTFTTSLPVYDSAGVTSALTALVASGIQWTWLRFVGPTSESVAATIDGIISGWDTSAKPSWGVADMRDRAGLTGGETLAAWSARVDIEYGPYTSTRLGMAKGRARSSCPINGRNNRRSAMAEIMPRAMGALGATIATDWGEVDLGPLRTSVSLTDVNLVTVEYDSNKDPNGVLMGAIALRTWPGLAGIYPAGATLMAPANDITRIPLRRIMNVAKIILRVQLTLEILQSIRFWVKGTTPAAYNVGDIFEPDALGLEASINAALKAGITSNGWVSSITWRMTRTPVSLGGGAWKVVGKMGLVSIGFIVVSNGTAQYVSPLT